MTHRVAQLMGAKFIRKNRLPIPIRVSKNRTSVDQEIAEVLNTTFVQETNGDCLTVRVGDTNMSGKELAENIRCAVAAAVLKLVHGGWNGVISMNVKAHRGPAVPLFLQGEETFLSQYQDAQRERKAGDSKATAVENTEDSKNSQGGLLELLKGKLSLWPKPSSREKNGDDIPENAHKEEQQLQGGSLMINEQIQIPDSSKLQKQQHGKEHALTQGLAEFRADNGATHDETKFALVDQVAATAVA
mmetsp:Transcript_26277/g.42246  ORF Transcript_26277/g.42246 Transcript_26277/m.42246 type:complete len:245 (+) Transcript_26277:137-871(+)